MPKFDPKEYAKSEHKRAFTLKKRGAIDEEARTVEVAFSSEEPVSRWFGQEILDHSPGSVRLGRLQENGAVLVDHDTSDLVGTVENARIDGDRMGRATLRFGRSARAQEIFADIVDDIRRSVSFAYRVYDMVLEREKEGEEPVYRVTDYEPYEISLVAVPADGQVGVGRSKDSLQETTEVLPMPEETQVREETPAPAPAPAAAKVDVDAVRADARKEELSRIRDINAIGDKFDMRDLAAKSIDGNHSVEQFRQIVLAQMADNADAGPGAVPEIGLGARELKRYSFVRAMAALANPESRNLREAAGFEFEVSQAAQDASGRRSMGFMVPPDLTRDLNVGTDTAGGHTVATELRSLIEILRNRSVIQQVGATMLTGLEGNVAFPRQTGAGTGYWVAEGSSSTESEQTFDQVVMSPKTVGAYTEYTRQLLLQSSIDVENFVRNDLARVLALSIDLAALYGSGASNQPTGISQQSGINAPTSFAAAVPTYSEVVAMESAVAVDNADVGSLAYVVEPSMRGSLKTADKFSGSGMPIWEPGNTLNGYNSGVSSQVTAGDVFFGNWEELLIGMWGGLDIMVNPYALDTSGGVRITALQSADIAVRHPVSFAFNNDGA